MKSENWVLNVPEQVRNLESPGSGEGIQLDLELYQNRQESFESAKVASAPESPVHHRVDGHAFSRSFCRRENSSVSASLIDSSCSKTQVGVLASEQQNYEYGAPASPKQQQYVQNTDPVISDVLYLSGLDPLVTQEKVIWEDPKAPTFIGRSMVMS